MDIAWGDCQGNVRRADAMIDNAPEVDLYILPEMFSTGFAADPERMDETKSGSERCCYCWQFGNKKWRKIFQSLIFRQT